MGWGVGGERDVDRLTEGETHRETERGTESKIRTLEEKRQADTRIRNGKRKRA